MNRFIVGSFTFLFLSVATAPVTKAQTQAVNSATTSALAEPANNLTPFELVTMAKQGYFKEQGIPSHQELIFAHQLGRIRAQELVAAAVRANKLSPQFLKERGYLNAVEAQLRIHTFH